MKKNFRLWLNIATICMCLCALVIGVYSAKQATLKVSGQIGFSAHGVVGTVAGTIKGHSNGKDSEPITTAESLGDSVEFDDATGLSLGNRYFSDMTEDRHIETITITLTITNKTVYPIKATLSLPEFQTNLTFGGSNFIAQLGAKGTSNSTQDMVIDLTLDSQKASDFELTNISFNIKFEKLETIEYDSTSGYYISMGSNIVTASNGTQSVKPVKWIPIAESSNGSTYTIFDNTNKPSQGKKYYFMSENILDFGKVTDNENCGVVYNNQCAYETTESLGFMCVSTESNYTNYTAHDYLISNVRKLLKGKTVYDDFDSSDSVYTPSGDEVNLVTEYGLQGCIYDSISSRNASELFTIGQDNISFSNYASTIKSGEYASDKLWLLSKTEVNSYVSSTDKIAKTFTNNGAVAGFWWTRTPEFDYGDIVSCISNTGELESRSIVTLLGVRPAFIFAV